MSGKKFKIGDKHAKKLLRILIIILNIIGIFCLIYFAIPFITHDMTIDSPNVMLGSYSWDTSGFILCLGLLPLIIANYFSYKIMKTQLKILSFIPSLICLFLVIFYLFISFTIIEETDGTYSLSMDENDKIPQNIIDYNSPNEIISSIEKYYKEKGGMCP